jgi:hypothetical protein
VAPGIPAAAIGDDGKPDVFMAKFMGRPYVYVNVALASGGENLGSVVSKIE